VSSVRTAALPPQVLEAKDRGSVLRCSGSSKALLSCALLD